MATSHAVLCPGNQRARALSGLIIPACATFCEFFPRKFNLSRFLGPLLGVATLATSQSPLKTLYFAIKKMIPDKYILPDFLNSLLRKPRVF
jgi:hypothetical protein